MSEINPSTQSPTSDEPKKKSRSIIWLTLIILIIAIVWIGYWFFYLRFYETTDDAYANGNFLTVNSVINGPIVAWYADDTDFVHEGDLLAKIDATNYQILFDKELVALKSEVLNVRQLFNQVNANQQIVENKKALLSQAKYDYDNRLELVDSQAISNEEFTHAKDAYEVAKLELKQAEYQYQVSVDAVGNRDALIEKHPLIEKQKTQVQFAYYQLQHCNIYASTSGYVAQRAVEVGQWVTPTTPLMSIIPTTYVWVDANFKETQLSKMRIGQPATVWFDLYGSSVEFKGKVEGIAFGSGSVFSLIPPQNATGNWIKIVQRLPVRISLDSNVLKDHPMRLGISATVDVDITDQSLPILTTATNHKPLAKTNVYDIQLEKVNQLIEEVIKSNLN